MLCVILHVLSCTCTTPQPSFKSSLTLRLVSLCCSLVQFNVYTFSPPSTHHVQRHTKHHQIPYYVMVRQLVYTCVPVECNVHTRPVSTVYRNIFKSVCVRNYVFCLGTSNRTVAVHSQDSMYMYMYLYKLHIQMYWKDTHMHTRTHTYTRTCTHMHSHTHTRTHTHTQDSFNKNYPTAESVRRLEREVRLTASYPHNFNPAS